MKKRLYKITAEKKVAGVCAGFAEFLNLDVTLVRVIALFLILASFSTMLIFYFICAIIMPDKNDIYQQHLFLRRSLFRLLITLLIKSIYSKKF